MHSMYVSVAPTVPLSSFPLSRRMVPVAQYVNKIPTHSHRKFIPEMDASHSSAFSRPCSIVWLMFRQRTRAICARLALRAVP